MATGAIAVARTRLTNKTGAPSAIPSASATAADAPTRSNTSTLAVIGRPSASHWLRMFMTGVSFSSTLRKLTAVPRPRVRRSTPASTSSASASRTVARLTPNMAVSSSSEKKRFSGSVQPPTIASSRLRTWT